MKRAFVGQTTPIVFDYKNMTRRRRGRSEPWPNPVLENVNGMLLCYDEIWFITRAHCPSDMRRLPYVKFIEDDIEMLERAKIARDQFTLEWTERSDDIMPIPNSDTYGRVFERLRNAMPFELVPDNHGRMVHDKFYGDATDGVAFVQDVGIAASIDSEMDIVTNSAIGEALHALQAGPRAVDFTQLHLAAAEEVVALRTVDRLGPRGAYHESIEDLRNHPRLIEFRDFLSKLEVPDKGAISLAREVNWLADRHARDVLDRFLRGNGRIETIGSASIGFMGNLTSPGLGSVLSGAYTATQWIRERSQRKNLAWSLFVLDARA